MRRSLAIPVLVGLLTVLGGARAPSPPRPNADRARQLHQDRRLIAGTVTGGLSLARTRLGDPLERVQCCNHMAEDLAAEIENSVQEGDGERVEVLGLHYRQLLLIGVVPNLNEARQKSPPGSTDERKLLDLGDRNVQLTTKLEGRLRPEAGRSNGEREVILRAVAGARAEVQKALPASPSRK